MTTNRFPLSRPSGSVLLPQSGMSTFALIICHDGTILEQGSGWADDIVTREIQPKLCDEARRLWGVENNLHQFGHQGSVFRRQPAPAGNPPCRHSQPSLTEGTCGAWF